VKLNIIWGNGTMILTDATLRTTFEDNDNKILRSLFSLLLMPMTAGILLMIKGRNKEEEKENGKKK